MNEERAQALRPGRRRGCGAAIAVALAAWPLAAGGAEVPVAGFESGIGGWLTNDGADWYSVDRYTFTGLR